MPQNKQILNPTNGRTPANHHAQTRYTSHDVAARIGVPTNRSSFVGWLRAVGPSGRTGGYPS
jgi:hypothetical protein